MKEEMLCPECGEPLSASLFIDGITDELIIDIGCESDEDDEYHFQIFTGLKNDDISDLDEIGKVTTKEMKWVLKKRISGFDD